MTTASAKAQSAKTTEKLGLLQEVATLEAEVLALGTSGADLARLKLRQENEAPASQEIDASERITLVGIQAHGQAGGPLELLWGGSPGRMTSCWRQASSFSDGINQT